MKNILMLLTAAFLLTISLGAQSLRDNPDYLKSLDLQEQSRAAFENGDYAEAQRLAEEAKAYAEKSDLWIADQLARYRANSALLRVRNRIQDADRVNGAANFPEEYALGKTLYEQAYQEFRSEEWDTSRATSDRALEALSAIVYVRPATGSLPAEYVVRLLPGNTDCLWNIAGYEFIYDDPWSWKSLYDANRDKFPEPDNPDLILPGMVLTIPSVDGEKRSGRWENGEIR